jgi:hypothetical protein
LLKAGGAGAAFGAFGTRWRGLVDDPPHDRPPGNSGDGNASTSSADPKVDLANVQGNVLA